MFSNKKSYTLRNFPPEKSLNLELQRTRSDNDICASNDIINQRNNSRNLKPVLGTFYMFLHSTFYQFTSIILKLLFYINPCQLTLIRSFSIFAAILPVTVYQEEQILVERKNAVFLFLRIFFGATALYFASMAYSYLPLAEASVILSTVPIITALIARIFLKEAFGLVQGFTFVMSVCGVLLALRIPKLLLNRKDVIFDSIYIAGLAAAIGHVLFQAFNAVLLRKLRQIHFSVLLLYFGLFGCVENAVVNGIFIPFVLPKCGLDQILCAIFGILGIISNMFFTMSFQVQPAGIASVQKSSFDILVIIVLQILFLNIYPDTYVICGACIVIASLIILGIRNGILIAPNASKRRNIFKCCVK